MIRSMLIIAIALAPMAAGAQDATGFWAGTYVCNQGLTAVTLEIAPSGSGVVALAHFFADRSNPRVPEGCFELEGAADASGRLSLTATQWRLRPSGYVTVDLTGALSPDGRTLSGQVIGPNCTTFQLRRMKTANTTGGVCHLKNLS